MSTKYDVINSQKYFYLLSKGQLTDEERDQVSKFEELMATAEKYRDYVTNSIKVNKDGYERGINQIAIQETTNPETSLTDEQKRALEFYNKTKENVLTNGENKVRKLEKNNDVSSGYTNSFVLILSTLATGILIGVVLFLIK